MLINKKEKRKQMALACKSLLIENRLCELSISKIAETSNIGKGTFYEYFENKEDLVYEIINFLFQDYLENKKQAIFRTNLTKEKVRIYFNFFFEDSAKEFRIIYKIFISIYLNSSTEKLKKFQEKYTNENIKILCEIINEGIIKKELKEESYNIIKELYDLPENIYLRKQTISESKKDTEQFTYHFYSLINNIVQSK